MTGANTNILIGLTSDQYHFQELADKAVLLTQPAVSQLQLAFLIYNSSLLATTSRFYSPWCTKFSCHLAAGSSLYEYKIIHAMYLSYTHLTLTLFIQDYP